ncbi:MAG: hypothetical protein JOY54_09050 [Acidobacteriaceae bacterium]|nr:hypothetical protein [Acidobacteriaceae bacterium]
MELARRHFLVNVLAAPALSAVGKRRVQTVAFNYAGKSSPEDLHFFSRFDVLVTGGILSGDQRQLLRSSSTRLVLYQWSSAYYPGDVVSAESSWQEKVAAQSHAWLLASGPVGGGAAASGKQALWYDFGNSDLTSARAEHICQVVKDNGYQGVFLDTLGFNALPAELKQGFQKRHPGVNYDNCQGDFLAKLRHELGPDRIIFTNQGYREPDVFLPHADFDLVENSSTFVNDKGTTMFRPWFQKGAEWESIRVPMTNLVAPAQKRFPDTQFVQLNYADGDPLTCQRAVRYAFACARLWNQAAFVATPSIQKPIRDNIYFTRLGEPSTPSYEEDVDAGAAWRRFQNGAVAVNTSTKPYHVRALRVDLTNPPKGYVFLGKRSPD